MEVGVRLFGVPAVAVDGAWLPLRPGKAGALLAVVAHRGEVVRRSEVAALLWPDADERRARTNLRQLLRTLAVGPLGHVLGRDASFVWARVPSDVVRFREAIGAARWRDAVELVRGPFLEGFDDLGMPDAGAWADSERAALAEAWRRAVLAAVGEAAAAGRHAAALELADRLVAADPLDEEAVAHALRAAIALGDRRAAERRLAALARSLREEVGSEPAATTRELLEPRDLAAPTALADVSGAPPVPDPASPARAVSVAPRPRAAPPARSVGTLIGRERELTRLTDSLRTARLVTVLAPGGMGKTALAVAAAEVVADDFPGGVVIASLDRSAEARALADAVAEAAGLVPGGATSVAAQIGAAWGDARVLLLLDGCEGHVAAPEALDELLAACPGLVVLATSRARWRHAREVVFTLDGLATEAAAAGSPRPPSAAARLFLREARRVQAEAPSGGFGTDEALGRIERIGAMLGGSPLAIELVASWLSVVPLADLERRVGEAWTFLRSDDAGRPAGQRDLEAVLWHVWDGLAMPERSAWARLAVLGGSVDGPLAARVGGGWRVLRSLADHAIVGPTGDRLAMHALVARFGRERAAETGDVGALWAVALPALRERFATEVDPASGHAVRHHDDALAHGVAAWRRAVAGRDAGTLDAMAFGLLRALRRTVRLREAASLAAAAVEALRTPGGRLRDRALARALPFAAVERLERRARAVEAVELAERVDDDRARAHALDWIARTTAVGDLRASFAAAAAAYERAGDRIGLAGAWTWYGEQRVVFGWYGEATEALDRAARLWIELADQLGHAEVEAHRARLLLAVGDVAGARVAAASARAVFEAQGAVVLGATAVGIEAAIERAAGSFDAASARTTEAIDLLGRFGPTTVVGGLAWAEFHERFGRPDDVLRNATPVLAPMRAPDEATSFGCLAYLALARAGARLADAAAAIDALGHACRMARAIASPRLTARVAEAAAEVFGAQGSARGAMAPSLALWAAHRSALDAHLRRDALARAHTSGTRAGPPPWDDEAALAAIERASADT